MYVENTVIRLGDRCQRSHCQLWKGAQICTMEAIGIHLIFSPMYLLFGHLVLLSEKMDIWSFIRLLNTVQGFLENCMKIMKAGKKTSLMVNKKCLTVNMI